MPFQLNDQQLKKLYGRRPARVAFVDEAYRVDGRGDPFYIVGAVVVDFNALDDLRDDLLDIVGDNHWHTVQALRDEVGRGTLRELTEYLGAEGSLSLCTVDTDPSHFKDVEAVRAFSMLSLAELAVVRYGAELMVYERRREGFEEDADKSTEKIIISKESTRDLRIHGGTPYSEPLLWVPDIISSTLRRRFAFGDGEWFEPLRSTTEIYRAGSDQRICLDPHT